MIPVSLKKFFGILPQEYVCVALEDVTDPFRACVTAKGIYQVLDISQRNLLLGYKPMLIAITFSESEQEFSKQDQLCLNLSQDSFNLTSSWHEFPTDPRCAARLVLKQIKHPFKVPGLCLFSGEYGEHSFL